MTQKATHIYPIFEGMLQRADKERHLQQRSKVLWLTGLSGSGKSTLAIALERELYSKGYATKLLDGDNIRSGINNNLGFTAEDRMENIRRIAEVAKLFVQAGVITICSFVSPTREIRALARQVIGQADFMEVYINCPLEICEQRDVKGLYKKARAGEIKQFTGIDAPFEPPEAPSLEVRTDRQTLAESVASILQILYPQIEYKD